MLHGTGHWPEEGIFMYAAISMDLKLFLISKMFFVYCFFFFLERGNVIQRLLPFSPLLQGKVWIMRKKTFPNLLMSGGRHSHRDETPLA